MKIVTWNCNGAFRKKIDAISSIPADLYIIQECENPTTVAKPSFQYQEFTEKHIWIGQNKSRGLGVFVENGHTLAQLELNQDFGESHLKWFLPFSIDRRFRFVAVWAHRGETGNFRYIGQFYKLLCNNSSKISNHIFVGDFNSNKIWDYKRSEGDHSMCLKILEKNGIHSVYHTLRNEQQVSEILPTFLLQRNKTKAYHIDYIFSASSHIERTKHFEVGDFDKWLEYSDHVPIVWEFEHESSGETFARTT
jgi:exonuclease III